VYDTIEIALTNDLREIPGIAAKIDEFCTGHDLAPGISYAANLALEELLANTINFGYEDDGVHRIEVIVRLEGELLVVVVIDDGIEFDPTNAEMQQATMSLEDEDMGGLGLLLINRMMDKIEYQRRANCNVVLLTKDTSETEAANEDGVLTMN